MATNEIGHFLQDLNPGGCYHHLYSPELSQSSGFPQYRTRSVFSNLIGMALSDYYWKQVDRSQYDPLDRIQYKRIEMKGDKRKIYHSVLPMPDEDGYYTDQIVRRIILEAPYLHMINIGVGQGKTTAVHRLIRKVYSKGYRVIVATPFTNLVEDYYNKIIKEIPEEDVFRYDELDGLKSYSKEEIEALASKRIHVMTINMLLGNPGESNFRQSETKRRFLKILREKYKADNEDVIIFFDEIHESIHNFKPEFIFNLHRWKGIVHSCFFVSATYTEPVFTAARHVAYLTDYKINIIEAERTGYPNRKKAELILYSSESNYSSKNIASLDFIRDFYLSENFTNIHVLSYSRKLASKLGKRFKSFGVKSNLVTSTSSSKLNTDESNIGTAFKTGVNIDNPLDLFVIILPPFQNASDYVTGKAGIFLDGIPSIIQAIARMRNGGKILVVLPAVKSLLDDPSSAFIRSLFRTAKICKPEFRDEEGEIESESGILHEFHAKEYYRLKEEIMEYNTRRKKEIELYRNDKGEYPNLIDIQFPIFEDFVLRDGQRYLVEYSERFGRNVVPYFLWAAFNDQFINARLDTIYFPKINFRKLEIMSIDVKTSIQKFCNEYGIQIVPTDNDSYFSCWDRFMKIVRSEEADGVRNKTEIIVNGQRDDKYARGVVLKKAFLELQYVSLTDQQLSSESPYEYLVHQSVCAKMKRFKTQHHIGKSYLELYESLDEVKEQIELCFNGELPMNYTEQRIDLNKALQRFGVALQKVWSSDPYLKGTTWHIPGGVKNMDVQKLYKIWKKGFVYGDKKRLRTSDGIDEYILKNSKYLHETLPEKYTKQGINMEPLI